MKIKVAASQFQTIKGNIKDNINKALNLADQAVAEGVNVLLLQELFQSEYFCSTQNAKFFDYAISSLDNELFSIFSNYCKKNNINFDVIEPNKRSYIIKSYSDNFIK